ncbi:MAG TPA: biotin carboxylase N-terminal domain-containing protein, partial [Kaistiaceae bacterium]|nr:biotin carboxylase N-terminal domain-containing protein [Kaistiaceae bacterium]
TIAVYSDADAKALHVRLADEAVNIGPAPVTESYLRAERIIAAAKETGAECIHPGYGFLSENAAFSEACAEAGIVFVGPPAAAIRAMGLKDGAKAIMEKAGVPVVPGYHGERQDPAFLKQKAYEIGYPVLIKAVAGGGGKGMRRVDKALAFEEALASAQREAKNAFGDERVLVEKYIESPRHVEVQVFADAHGNAVHLFERDCSVQRRHQKVVEEAPAPGMTEAVRAAMGAAAVAAAKAVGYVGAGTVEFIADGSTGLRPDGFWFMEMNTRLQVEHPVTEEITGLDLVAWQLMVAAGEALPLGQDELAIDGHAVEARLYAEDPDNGFLPSIGDLVALDFGAGEGIRVDTGVSEGGAVSPFYDPMIAKVIAHGATRDEAFDRLAAALRATVVAGPRTNLGFLARLLDHPEFRAGNFDTGFLDRHLDDLVGFSGGRAAVALGALRLVERDEERIRAETARRTGEPDSPWNTTDAFQLGPERRFVLPVTADGDDKKVELAWGPEGLSAAYYGAEPDWHDEAHGATIVDAPDGVYVLSDGVQTFVKFADPAAHEDEVEAEGRVGAPMHGKLVAMFVAPGQQVAKGDRLFIVEAMKMEHAVASPMDGVIADVRGVVGDQLDQGATVIVFEETEGEG